MDWKEKFEAKEKEYQELEEEYKQLQVSKSIEIRQAEKFGSQIENEKKKNNDFFSPAFFSISQNRENSMNFGPKAKN